MKESYTQKRTRRARSMVAVEAKRRRRLVREEASRNFANSSDSLSDTAQQSPTQAAETPPPNASTSANDAVEASKPIFEGRRVISCVSLIEFAQKLSRHGWDCKGNVDFVHETTYHGGLCREQTFKCECGWMVQLTSDTGQESLPINDSITWGMQAAAVGYDSMSVIATAMDLPFPSKSAFSSLLQNTQDSFTRAMNDDIRKAGEEERRLAIEAGDFVVIEGQKYARIVVILDGGWDKRTYGHGYDANSGVAVIIGCRTGKVLFSGTRTKICFNCALAKTRGEQPKTHTCNKNWSNSSTSMEADILAEGFRRSIEMHGLVYASFIGDGDSSTHFSVENIYPGMKVAKIECYNHALKNFHKKLHDIANDSVRGKNAPRIPKEDRQLPGIEKDFRRIHLDVRSAIIYNHQFKDTPNQAVMLSDDLCNVIRHVFGEHSQCKPYFCDPLGEKRNEENRYQFMTTRVLFGPLMTAISRLASMASSLIQKMNTNRAECFMSVANKYTEGKRKSLGAGCLYKLRMSCAVLSYNNNRFWLANAYRTVYGKEPLSWWLTMEKREIIIRNRLPKRRTYKTVCYGFLKNGRTKGDEHYGSEAKQPPLSTEVRTSQIQKLRESLNVDISGQGQIEKNTRDQSNCDAWFAHRRPRITASLAGRVFKLKPTSDNTSILNSIFQQRVGCGTIAMKYGTTSEPLAIAAYERLKGLETGSVQKVGLLVSLENGVLGSSPDGLVGDKGLLECKCPYSIRDTTPTKWPELSKANCPLTKKSLTLKTTHNHYYQVLMQLYTSGRDWVDYFIWTPKGHYIQRITRDDSTLGAWLELKEKLLHFWEEDVAPELVDPRDRRKSKEYLCSEERMIGRKRLEDRRNKIKKS